MCSRSGELERPAPEQHVDGLVENVGDHSAEQRAVERGATGRTAAAFVGDRVRLCHHSAAARGVHVEELLDPLNQASTQISL